MSADILLLAREAQLQAENAAPPTLAEQDFEDLADEQGRLPRPVYGIALGVALSLPAWMLVGVVAYLIR